MKKSEESQMSFSESLDEVPAASASMLVIDVDSMGTMLQIWIMKGL